MRHPDLLRSYPIQQNIPQAETYRYFDIVAQSCATISKTPVDLARSTVMHHQSNHLGSRLHLRHGVLLPADQMRFYNTFQEFSTLPPKEAFCSGHSNSQCCSGLPRLVYTPPCDLESKASHSPQAGSVGRICFWSAVRSNTSILVLRLQLTRLTAYP